LTFIGNVVPVIENPVPLTVAEFTVMVAVPVLPTLIVLVEDVPGAIVPKSSDPGVTVIVALPPAWSSPVPAAVTVSRELVALLAIATDADKLPVV
jgi:hypothetical protein